MSVSVTVVIPVWARPHRVGPVADSIAAAGERCDVLFVCNHDDPAEIAAVRAHDLEPLVVDWPAGTAGDYAKKINLAAKVCETDWVFTGADDLRFHPGWLTEALKVHEETGALVVGTNDMHNPTVVRGDYATHLLVHRDFFGRAVVDQPGNVFCDLYAHNCNPGEAPIWMGDLGFKRIDSVVVGDEVIGWQRIETGKHSLRRLARATVLAVHSRRAETVTVELESGRSLRCTADHRWLDPTWSPSTAARWGKRPEFRPAEVGRRLLHVIDVPDRVPAEHERLAGWIAGLYDGEGSGVYIASQSTRQNPEVCAAIGPALETLGIAHTTPMASGDKGVVMYCMTGGRQAYLDFLLRIQPVKTERLAALIFEGSRRGDRDYDGLGRARFGDQDRIVAIKPGTVEEVFALTTTTGNYIAWGYASKNCVDSELVETAKARGVWAFAVEARVEHLHPVFGGAPNDRVYAHGRAGHSRDRVLFRRRRRLWLGRPAMWTR